MAAKSGYGLTVARRRSPFPTKLQCCARLDAKNRLDRSETDEPDTKYQYFLSLSARSRTSIQ